MPKKSEMREELLAAVAAIHRVHGDGALPPIPVKPVASTRQEGGFTTEGGKPKVITITSGRPRKALALVHEVGHFLDFAGLHRNRFGSEAWLAAPSELAALFKEISKSKTYLELNRMLAKKQLDFRVRPNKVDRYVRSLADHAWIWRELEERNRPTEWLARAYSQYIAHRSGEPLLLEQLTGDRAKRAIDLPGYWSDDEFVPIADAFDKLFLAHGWLKPQRPGTNASSPGPEPAATSPLPSSTPGSGARRPPSSSRSRSRSSWLRSRA